MALGTKRIDQLTPASAFVAGDLAYILRGSATDLAMDIVAAVEAQVAASLTAAKEAYAYDGLVLSYVSTTSFSVGAGVVGDDTHVQGMRIASTITKTTSTWVVGTAAGGLDAGTIATLTWYYVYLIKRVDTGVVDVLFSVSATAPTMPSGYTLKRLIGCVKTNGSSQFRQWVMYPDGTQEWLDSIADVSDSTLTTTRKSYTLLTVPPISCKANLYVDGYNGSGGVSISLYGNNSVADVAPSNSPNNVTYASTSANSDNNRIVPMTILAGLLYARASSSSTTLVCQARDFNIRQFH